MRWRALTVALIALVAIGAGLLWIFSDKASASTDDAYVQADKTIVSPKVRGMVLQIVAQENRPVKAGDLLAKIDPEEYDLLISKAQGDLMAARASEAAARAGLSRLDAEEKLAEGAVNSAEQLAGPKGATDPIFRQAFETAHGQRWSRPAPAARSRRRWAKPPPPNIAPRPNSTRPSCRSRRPRWSPPPAEPSPTCRPPSARWCSPA
ncbi:MAG: biotin/lipoyl-binding protein [Caulobacteraceae bacterium]